MAHCSVRTCLDPSQVEAAYTAAKVELTPAGRTPYKALLVWVEFDDLWIQQAQTIMRRFHRILEDNPSRPIYLLEICATIRVPERTLRLCCQEHLGMSPRHYLLLRRMQQARRALIAATTAETAVSEIATRFGFWQFGRFAGTYQAIFGEPPSATLHE